MQNYSDPTRGGAITQGITLSGGNLELDPETAQSYTFGVDFTPNRTSSRISLTYFHIDYEKQITSYLSDLSILNRESQFAGTGIIVRNPDPAFVATLVSDQADPRRVAEPGDVVRGRPHQQPRHHHRRGLRSGRWITSSMRAPRASSGSA